MGLRPARATREPSRVPYTRKSRSNMTKNYIKTVPHQHLTQFQMGQMATDYSIVMSLVGNETFYHRDNALEAARMSANRHLDKFASAKYYLRVRKFPHQVIRENKMVAGAGADRISKGMRKSFGRPTSKAALLKKGEAIFTVQTYPQFVPIAKEAFTKAARKLSGSWKIVDGAGI